MRKDTTYNPDNKHTHVWIDDSFVARSGHEKGGDDLGRTSLAYIAWGDPRMKDTIVKHFVFEGDKIVKIYRSIDKDGEYGDVIKGYDAETMSRDHVILALSALKVMGDDEDCKRIAKALGWKVSERYSWDLGSWTWIKHLAGNFWFPEPWLMHLGSFFMFIPILLNKNNFFHRSLRSYWGFVQHFHAWQWASSRDSWLKRAVAKFMIPFVEYRNVLLRYMFSDKYLDQSEIDHVRPHKGYQWARWFSDTMHKVSSDEPNDDTENLLDIDLMKAVQVMWPRDLPWDTMDGNVHASWWDRLTKGWKKNK